jgi:hypothetical protein
MFVCAFLVTGSELGVIAGLVPAIHLCREEHLAKKMDPRVKPYDIHTSQEVLP